MAGLHLSVNVTTFSVIIPTYNRRQHLLACLASISAQRLRPNEVIVVDDGSTDGTQAALAGIEGVTLIQQPNAGPGAARNRGAAAASGDYLAFLDSDDLWFPWTLEVFAELITRYRRPRLLFARYEEFSGEDSSAAEEAPEGLSFPTFFHSSAYAFIAGAGMMVIDRQAFLEVGGFAEDRLNAEDHDLALRLGSQSGFVQTLRPTVVGHRIHTDNETHNIEKTMRGIARLIERERAGTYPGGDVWKDARRTVIARHVRPAVLQTIRVGNIHVAWALYRDTLSWNVRAGRAGFILASPLLMLRAAARAIVGARNAPSTR